MSDRDRRAKELLGFFGIEPGKKLGAEDQEKLRIYLWHREKQEKLRTAQAMKRAVPIGRAAIGLVEDSAYESPIEADLAYALSTKSLTSGRVRPQYPVGPYSVDIAFPEVRLAVECDGRPFHSSPADVARDQHRTQYLAKLGWRVLRFTGREIKQDVYGCVDRIVRLYESLCSDYGVGEPWE